MASPRLGVVRESMLANPLHFRPSLGQSRSMHLPLLPRLGPDFVYGTRTITVDGGVAEALSSWGVQPAPGGSAHLQPLRVDYVSLNREGVRSGLVTAKEMNQYRAQWASENHHHHHHNLTHTRQTNRTSGVPDITFGIATRPPSPLSDLLAHQYGQRWLDEQQRHNTTPKHPDKAKLRISGTRTSLLRRSIPLPKSEPQCTIRRFTKVGPALDTFRDPESRLRAFRAHRSDCVSRRGTLGQGTYNLD